MVAIVGGKFFLFAQNDRACGEPIPEAVSFVEIAEEPLIQDSRPDPIDNTDNDPIDQSAKEPLTQDLPPSINLSVPFTSQAPQANWDLPYQEACEEASVLMVDWYYKGVEEISIEEADRAILDLITFEEEQGLPIDLTGGELAELIQDYFGYTKVEVLENPSIESLKEHLSARRPVIVPAAGRLLENPHFRSPGPIYHMFVLRGYMDNVFITNDPGTRHGEAYLYPFDTVYHAMHDWNGGEVEIGAKQVVVIYP
ncbi:MAG: hypothetical protein UX57_C0022G0010 [Candidatus Uhrbacteria bacterium GW2011_GWE2_46_68]|uniref:Peptidase C39-like domain-containing protein n=2 Tax=Candidatus Uhriibacteriota TaxID=1752732 RepID=A0A0G1Q596_9BACT|nr:MAG: hypothetical protein UX45_C0032G0008 [Candidatus Uhrbacteria bacterium GW2011_GWF2_46_218]KKU40211.1 MAG: hypothetical protein UX57_C0022G0010 [Candidatus Uhrbacteria bacterium GW2011_GWE2_46_68]